MQKSSAKLKKIKMGQKQHKKAAPVKTHKVAISHKDEDLIQIKAPEKKKEEPKIIA